MKNKNQDMATNIPFNLQQWLARESVNDKVLPNDCFPRWEDSPYFRRKFEISQAYLAKHPIPDNRKLK